MIPIDILVSCNALSYAVMVRLSIDQRDDELRGRNGQDGVAVVGLKVGGT